jgi:CheY-like chemotaxis protein
MSFLKESLRILLVDDDEDDAFFFQLALARAAIPCRFTRLLDGPSVLKLFANPGNPRPDIVFLDLKLPVMSGFEVLERLQTNGGEYNIVVLSGSAQTADAQRAMALGARKVLEKPITAETILNIVTEIAEPAATEFRASRASA